jgi:general secretion pathway protein D
MMRRAAVLGVVLLAASIRQVAAQPADKASANEPPAEDEPLFHCKSRPGGPILVTLKAESDVKDLLAWVMGFACKNFVLDPRVVATGRKVSIITPNKMTAADAYQVFLGALSTIGLTVVPRGAMMRIVESQQAHKEALPLIRKGVPDDVEQVVRYVYKPSYIAAEPLRQACQGLKSDAGEVVTLGQILLITDYASKVREMLSFAKLVDVPGGSDGIYALPVRHADAAKLTEKLNAILGVPGGGAAPARPAAAGADAGKTEPRPEASAVPSKIVVDERTNTLIIASSEAGYQRVKALVERLDIALEIEGGTAIHVYPLGSAVAEELAKTLTTAIGESRAKPAAGAPGQPPALPAAAAASGSPAGELGAALDGPVRVIADPPTNSLIVMSSGRDFLAIKDVIKQLDLPRREVYLEVMILEVEASDDTTLGTTSHGGKPVGDNPGNGDSAVLFGGVKTRDVNTIAILDSLKNATGLFGGLTGPAMTLLGQSIPSYAVLFQAVAAHTRANIISSPSIIAVDNVEAKYKVGQKIPVNKGTVLTPFGGSATAAPNIELTEFPLKLDIKPHISNDDLVLLEVKHEADQLQVESPGPRSSTRSFETRVVVHDQETVVLGGLTQDRESTSVTKVPLLGDIPLLGYLFKTTVRTKQRTNLLVLLTPYIIKDRRDLQAIHERKLREHDEFARSMTTLDRMAYEPRIDYRKKRGLLEEINRAVQDVEQDVAARKAVAPPRQVEAGSIDTPREP